MESGPITSWQTDREKEETGSDFIFLGSEITADNDCSHEIKRLLLLGRTAKTNLDSVLKSRHHFANKDLYSPSCGFSSSHVWMWELDHKEDWIPKNWCFPTVVLEKALESPLDCKEIQPVKPKGNQPWIFTGRNGAEAETPILWPPDTKNQLTGEERGSGKDWGQWEKGAAEDDMGGWHHWLDGHESEQTQGDSEGQRILAYFQGVANSRTRLSKWTTITLDLATNYLLISKTEIRIIVNKSFSMVSLLKKYTVNLIMRKISQIERHYIKHMAWIHPNVNDDPKGKKKGKVKELFQILKWPQN